MLNLRVHYTLTKGSRKTNKMIDLMVKNNSDDDIHTEAKIQIARHERVPFNHIEIMKWINQQH